MRIKNHEVMFLNMCLGIPGKPADNGLWLEYHVLCVGLLPGLPLHLGEEGEEGGTPLHQAGAQRAVGGQGLA